MKNKGFTLIELMIVIAIIGILVSIVMPGYRNYVLESQRTDTQGKLLQILELQERFYLDNLIYTLDLDADPNAAAIADRGLGYATDPLIISYNGAPAYSIAALACNLDDPAGLKDIYVDAPLINRCFRLIATPLGDQVNDGALIADNRGRRIHDFASIQPRDWSNNDLGTDDDERKAVCPECEDFPDRDDE